MKFLRRLTKNGNSMMVTIPPQVIDALRLSPADPLILEVPDVHTLIIRRATSVDDLRASAQPMTIDNTLPAAR